MSQRLVILRIHDHLKEGEGGRIGPGQGGTLTGHNRADSTPKPTHKFLGTRRA